MSYESLVVLFIVFVIPAGIYLVTSIIRLRQHGKDEQAELDLLISKQKSDSGKIGI